MLTHNYTGYPMVRHARETGALTGELGDLRHCADRSIRRIGSTEPISQQTGQKQAAVAHRSEAVGCRRFDG